MIDNIINNLQIILQQNDDNFTSPHDDVIYRPHSARVARYQVIIASTLGLTALLLFSILRLKYPKIYVANFNHLNFSLHSTSRRNLPELPSNSLFGWIPTVYKITEQEILEHAGLDAVVFLEFFKMCIRIISICLVFAIIIISPIRYKFTGRVDEDYPDDDSDNDDDDGSNNNGTTIIKHIVSAGISVASKNNDGEQYQQFLWLYTIFTYVFTFVTVYFLFKQTNRIISMRQKYLGSQNSVTDRTVKISGIPGSLRDEVALARHIDRLNIGEVDSVLIVKEWQNLNKLFKRRRRIVRKLEESWVEYFEKNGITNKSDLISLHPQVGESYRFSNRYTDDAEESPDWGSQNSNSAQASIIDQDSESVEGDSSDTLNRLLNDESRTRPSLRKGWFGLFGPKVDSINYYTDKLEVIDKEITRARTREYPATSTAFLTMKTVAEAQMLAQAVLDPKVNHLITNLAPAPHDIRWDNLSLTRQDRNTRSLSSRYLLFFKHKSISKIWPSLGKAIESHKWAETLITGLLPTYLFTILNIVIPFFYVWISEKQGYLSHSDEELSSVSKNFFYIFVNLFLVFTTFGTASFVDTTKIAFDLARSLRDLSMFYVDLIILQGLGIFPFKLLLVGNLLRFLVNSLFRCKTPRDYLNLYKPPVFNFGLQLPQPILIFIITLVYSNHIRVISFSNHMVGTLALQDAITCATFLAPLPFLTLYFWWSFHKQYIPLSTFIALRAIESNENINPTDLEQIIENNNNKTLDERRELNTKYEYPNLVNDLDGPMIALDGEDVLIVNRDGTTVRKPPQYFSSEWDY
ncbi:hypothetical protein FOB64_000302 [Candida albicans]|uniref:Calcium permeable stress-gated cation channel 1 n=1 Tax=Candida albicans TaxID=5476 RepID=A0A8H6F6X5_CANAX|nr:hypothetical protein FOB64_000302 [Candida albicans]